MIDWTTPDAQRLDGPTSSDLDAIEAEHHDAFLDRLRVAVRDLAPLPRRTRLRYRLGDYAWRVRHRIAP